MMLDNNNNNMMCNNNNNRRRTRPCKQRGARTAVAAVLIAASVYSGNAGRVAGFSSSFRPMATANKVTSKHTVYSSLPAERLDTEHQGINLPPPLDIPTGNTNNGFDEHEFELSVGHAMDTLRTDYPEILTLSPDFSIYDSQLEVIDPSGVKLHGVKNYKATFNILHALVGLLYCPERSGLTFRMCYDKARQNIRIHWNAQVIPKAIFGGVKTTLHVDGISVYEISKVSGNITQHRIERLVINDNPIAPQQGVFAAMSGVASKSRVSGVGILNIEAPSQEDDSSSMTTTLQFQNFVPASRSVLFSQSSVDDDNKSSSTSPTTVSTKGSSSSSSQLSAMMESSSSLDGGNVDWDALEKKNVARKNFGLKPLTPEEFVDLQEQVKELDIQQQKRADSVAAEMAEKKAKDENPGFFKKLFGEVMQDTCDSNYDCERPEVCCDFGFKKVCCSSGMFVTDGPPRSKQGQLAEIPVIQNPGPKYPPTDTRNGGEYLRQY